MEIFRWFALFLLALSLVSAKEGSFLVVIPEADENLMNSLVTLEKDVRGFFGGNIILYEEKISSIAVDFPEALFFTPYPAETYFVIEGTPSAEFEQMVAILQSQKGFHLTHVTKDFILGSTSHTSKLLSPTFLASISIPWDAEFTTLPSKRILPTRLPSSHPIHQRRKALKLRSSVEELVAAVNEADIGDFARFLSGEADQSDFVTRHSLSKDAVRSGEWAVGVLSNYGFNASLETYGAQIYCPNVIAELRGTSNPDQIVIIGAHLDCRNRDISDSTGRAPGANDDGSGSSAILQIAKVIFESKATFKTTVRLGLWCGEEQGLIGSRAHAANSVASGENIIGMFQADMIGYQGYSTPQCAFVNRYTNDDLTAFSRDVATLYVPEIAQVTTTACCSDHQSFYEQGYPSVGLVEGGGYTIDPKYHNVDDTVDRDGYNLNQIQSIARVLLASAAELAGLN